MASSRRSLRPRSIALAAVAGLTVGLASGMVSTGSAFAAERPSRGCVSSVPYAAGQNGYDTYRIPATVTTRTGAVLAFAEGRRDGAGDTGNIDVVLRRSFDGGCTWGPLSVVAPGKGDTRGNPAPVVDPRTGKVVLLTSYNSGAVTEAQIMRGEVTAEQSRMGLRADEPGRRAALQRAPGHHLGREAAGVAVVCHRARARGGPDPGAARRAARRAVQPLGLAGGRFRRHRAGAQVLRGARDLQRRRWGDVAGRVRGRLVRRGRQRERECRGSTARRAAVLQFAGSAREQCGEPARQLLQ